LGADDLRSDYDRVVVAAGSWTAAVLRASGLPADGYRVKSIQYAIYPATGWPPTTVVDDVTGMYGLPDTDGYVLLGLATDRWDVEPDRPPFDPAVQEEAVRLAQARFPALRLGPPKRQVGSADCYAEDPMLMLRPVLGNVVTFTGGAGASVKTALAASRQAANELTGASG